MFNEVRVLIIAADPLARAGLSSLLSNRPGLQIVGQLAAADDLAAELEAFQAEVLLWDLGWEVDTETIALVADVSEVGLPLLTLLPDEEAAAEVWAAGSGGMLLRDAPPAALTAAVQALAQDLQVIAPSLSQGLLGRQFSSPAALPEPLTPRELEVLQALAEGLTNKAIAHRLSISDHTVKFHVNAILSKLNAQSRTEAVVTATRLGLLLL